MTLRAFLILLGILAPLSGRADRASDMAMIATQAIIQKGGCIEVGDLNICKKTDLLAVSGMQSFFFDDRVGGRRVDWCRTYYLLSDKGDPLTHLVCSQSLTDPWILMTYKQDAQSRLPNLLDEIIEAIRKLVETQSFES